MYDRIKMIRDMVEKGMVSADIGTDHALLPVMLVEDHISPFVYACDVSEGPLERAKETIHAHHLEKVIQPILSNGFANVPADAKVAIIAGMGYETAVKILTDAEGRLSAFKQILLELHADPAFIRHWISEKGYRINNECFCEEKGHGYTCISIHPSEKGKMTEEDIIVGPVLKQKKEPAYLNWLYNQYTKADVILKKSNGKAPDAAYLITKRTIIQNYLDKEKKLHSLI